MPVKDLPHDPNAAMVVTIGAVMAATGYVSHLITKAILDGLDEARKTVHLEVVIDGNTLTADTFTDVMLSMLQEGMREDPELFKKDFRSDVFTLHQKKPEKRVSMSIDRFLSTTKSEDLWKGPL